MPFIGKQPETGAFKLIDSITTSATATYALTVNSAAYFPESARNLIVSLNGVTQAPESAYTVSGSNIVFASALTASDVIDYILVIGDAVDIGTPSDNTVGTDQIASSVDLSGKTLTFANDQISGNVIDGGTISNFASTGIDDNAASTAITISSSGTLTHNGPDSSWYSNSSANNTRLDLIPTNGSVTYRAFSAGTDSTPSHVWNTQGSTHMTLNSSGNLGIGTTSPSTKLHLGGSAPLDSIIRQDSTVSGTNWEIGERVAGKWQIFEDDNDTVVATFQSNGNVGIGTASPTGFSGYTSLDINNATNGALIDLSQGDAMKGRLVATSSTMAIETAASVPILFQPAGTERMRIDSSGNVGIGTTSPSKRLHIDTATNGGILLEDSANSITGIFYSSGSNSLALGSTSNHPVKFFTNNSERMRLDASGNLGIGTASPNAELHIINTTPKVLLQSSGAGTDNTLSFISRNISNVAAYADIIGLGAGHNSTNAPILFTQGSGQTERMRIDSSGRLGVGMTNPDYVAVFSDTTSATRLVVENTNNGAFGTGVYMRVYSSGSLVSQSTVTNDNAGNLKFFTGTTSSPERMRIDNSGRLLVGITSATVGASSGQLVVGFAGNVANGIKIYDSYTSASTNNAMVFIRGSSEVGTITTTTSSTAYNTSSDQRLKENIVDAPAGNIDAIRVRSFDWKADGAHQTYGMVAQELVEVAPEAVSQGQTEDDMWGVDYSKLVPMMIKEIQDLKAEVAALKGA